MKNNRVITPIDNDELELIESINNDEWLESEEEEKYIVQAKEYAEATIKKDKRMNIRISERDLKNLKVRALEEGLPYQTLVSMILHKYVSGKLIEKSSNYN